MVTDMLGTDAFSRARRIRLSNDRVTALGGRRAGSPTNVHRSMTSARGDPSGIMKNVQTALSGRGPESPGGTTLLVRKG